MLRYKNSLLERILLEKGQRRRVPVAVPGVALVLMSHPQVSMSRLSCVPRLAVPPWGRLIFPRTWCPRRPFSVLY